MKYGLFCLLLFIVFPICINQTSANAANNNIVTRTGAQQMTYILPAPKTDGEISVEKALSNRRSRRDFQNKALSTDQLSQILWASYGISSPRGLRTAPSAGARYPLEIYAIIGNVEGIEPGVYRYIPSEHKIVRTIDKDVRKELSEAALGQNMVAVAPASVFYSAVFNRTTATYGERGLRYVYMDLGHSAQNIYLQVEALHLGTCAIGAFTDKMIRQVLELPANEEPLYLMPIGYY
jgi:SagB-type dehydrogenase family enzyme